MDAQNQRCSYGNGATLLFFNVHELVYQWIDVLQAPVVQRLDNAIHRINRYPVDKC